MEQIKILVNELTVEEFTNLFAQICGMMLAIMFIGVVLIYVVCKITGFIMDGIHYLIRKDKYKSPRDFVTIRALRHMGRLRNQVKNARSEKAYYLFYNRLLGAFHAYVELGIFKYEIADKLLDVRGVYVFNEVQRKMYEGEKNESTEECAEINKDN